MRCTKGGTNDTEKDPGLSLADRLVAINTGKERPTFLEDATR